MLLMDTCLILDGKIKLIHDFLKMETIDVTLVHINLFLNPLYQTPPAVDYKINSVMSEVALGIQTKQRHSVQGYKMPCFHTTNSNYE